MSNKRGNPIKKQIKVEQFSKKEWKRIFEVFLKESRRQKEIIESKSRQGLTNESRKKAFELSEEIKRKALINAGGPN